MSDLDTLKIEAKDLGITHHTNIGANKLAEKIEAHYQEKESTGENESTVKPTVEIAPVEEDTLIEEVKPSKTIPNKMDKRRAREKKARETRIITIIDNDQRVNNQTTTCTVSCANEFFDLGTKILPLNEKLEVCNGHISTLVGIKIPLHMRDNKTGLSIVKLRPRYTISYDSV